MYNLFANAGYPITIAPKSPSWPGQKESEYKKYTPEN